MTTSPGLHHSCSARTETRESRRSRERKKERGVEGWKGKMVSSLSPAGLVHCPAASAETALCPAHHPPAAADTGSSSSRRLKTSQTSPNLHTNRIRVLNKPRAQVRVSSCASQNCRKLCVCASLIRGAAERGILEKKAGMRKKKSNPRKKMRVSDDIRGWCSCLTPAAIMC